MTASLYQSVAFSERFVGAGMQLTFAAQSAPRNHPFTRSKDRHPAGSGPKESGHVSVAAFEVNRVGNLSFNFGALRSDALPFAAPIHPGVGEQERTIEGFAIFTGADFTSAASHHGDVRAEAGDVELFVLGGLISVLVAFIFGKQLGPVDEFAFRRDADEISRDESFDRRIIVGWHRRFPSVLHILNAHVF